MRLLRLAILQIRSSWEHFATRMHLRSLPAVPAITVVLALGLLIPLAAAVQTRPTDLAPSLAAERLARFAHAHRGELVRFGPAGELHTQRPAFLWPDHPEAHHYVFRLFRDDGTTWVTAKQETPCFLLRAPGNLEPGQGYRYEVEAFGEDGGAVAWQSDGRTATKQKGSFTVREPSDEVRSLLRRMALELESPEAAYVLAGYYAAQDSPFDVLSALFACAELSPGRNFPAELRDHLRAGDAEAWLAGMIAGFGARFGE